MSSAEREYTTLATSDQDKEDLHNDALAQIEGAQGKVFTQAMGDADKTPDSTDALHNLAIDCTGALTAARNLILPTKEALWIVKNSTTGGFAVTAKTSAGTGIAVLPGEERMVRGDGTNIVRAGAGRTVMLQFGFSTIPATNDRFAITGGPASAVATELYFSPVPFAGTIKELVIHSDSGPDGANIVFTVRKNGVDTALTCTITDGNSEGSDVTHSFTVARGDLISVKAEPGALSVQASRVHVNMVLEED